MLTYTSSFITGNIITYLIYDIYQSDLLFIFIMTLISCIGSLCLYTMIEYN